MGVHPHVHEAAEGAEQERQAGKQRQVGGQADEAEQNAKTNRAAAQCPAGAAEAVREEAG